MELAYEMLWTACTAILLCFLVASLISVVVHSTPVDSVSRSVIMEKRSKRTATLLDDDDDGVDKKIHLNCGVYGDRLKVKGARSKKKRVKFADQAAKVLELRSEEEVFVRDIEVVYSESEKSVEETGELAGNEVNVVDEITEKFTEKVIVEENDNHSGEFGDLSDKIVECEGFLGKDGVLDRTEEVISEIVGRNRLETDVVLDCDKEDEENDNHSNESRTEGIKNVKAGEFGDLSDKIVECAGFLGKDGVLDRTEEVISEIVDRNRLETGVVFDCDKEEDDDDQREEVKSSNVYEGEKSSELSDEEEWEGIERSELEKEFAKARDLVDFSKIGADDDVVMQLHGLEKIAMEGPCHEPQPMALRLSARAKWNAWQSLGNMSPEEAMKQYIALLSKNLPERMEEHSADKE